MKRSEFQQLLAEDLRKHKNIFRGYKKGSINLRCATDNLASYLMKIVDEHMKPPFNHTSWYLDGDNANQNDIRYHEWEKETTCGFCDEPCGNPHCVTKRDDSEE